MGTACPSQLKLRCGLVQLESWEPCIRHLWIHPGEQCLQLQATPPASFPLSTRGSGVELVLSPEICEDAPESGGTAVPSCETIRFSSPHNLWPVALHRSPWHLFAWDLLLGKEGAKGRPRQ